MISITGTAVEAVTPDKITNSLSSHTKPVVICGSCGAQEQLVADNKTECPNCDEYIY